MLDIRYQDINEANKQKYNPQLFTEATNETAVSEKLQKRIRMLKAPEKNIKKFSSLNLSVMTKCWKTELNNIV